MQFELTPAQHWDTNNAVSVLQVHGEATWRESAGSPRQPLQPGTLLPTGAVVSAEADTEVELLLPRGAGTLTLESRTRILLVDEAGEDVLGVYVSEGRVRGALQKDSLRLFNGCGASLQLTPQVGMSSPFSFGSTLPQELWDAMLGLGMNPDVVLPPLYSEGTLGGRPDTYISPYPTDVIIPEPSMSSLVTLGLGVLSIGWCVARGRREKN